jgi:hypothetical protein
MWPLPLHKIGAIRGHCLSTKLALYVANASPQNWSYTWPLPLHEIGPICGLCLSTKLVLYVATASPQIWSYMWPVPLHRIGPICGHCLSTKFVSFLKCKLKASVKVVDEIQFVCTLITPISISAECLIHL